MRAGAKACSSFWDSHPDIKVDTLALGALLGIVLLPQDAVLLKL